jgi:hypothetical protein
MFNFLFIYFKVAKEASEAAIKTFGGTNAASMKIIETGKTTSNKDDEDGVILDSDYSKVDDALTTEGEAEYEYMEDSTSTIQTMEELSRGHYEVNS